MGRGAALHHSPLSNVAQFKERILLALQKNRCKTKGSAPRTESNPPAPPTGPSPKLENLDNTQQKVDKHNKSTSQ